MPISQPRKKKNSRNGTALICIELLTSSGSDRGHVLGKAACYRGMFVVVTVEQRDIASLCWATMQTRSLSSCSGSACRGKEFSVRGLGIPHLPGTTLHSSIFFVHCLYIGPE